MVQPGDKLQYTDEDGVTRLATVINIYTDDSNTDIATISLSGTDKILKVENNFD